MRSARARAARPSNEKSPAPNPAPARRPAIAGDRQVRGSWPPAQPKATSSRSRAAISASRRRGHPPLSADHHPLEPEAPFRREALADGVVELEVALLDV